MINLFSKNIALSWIKPIEADDKDINRGFRIIEKNGRVGSNWSVYVPVEAEKNNYQVCERFQMFGKFLIDVKSDFVRSVQWEKAKNGVRF